MDYPVVPMQVNCYGSRVIVNRGGATRSARSTVPEGELDPPGPSPERCMEVGAAVVRVLKRSPWRVAVIASSSWSHAFLAETSTSSTRMSMRTASSTTLSSPATTTTGAASPNNEVELRGHQEVRNWWALMGAMEELGHKGPAWHELHRSYVLNSSKCFAIYDPV